MPTLRAALSTAACAAVLTPGLLTGGQAVAATSGSTAAATSVATSVATMTPAARLGSRLYTDGCHYDTRGIASCTALMGAAYGANTDPTSWEKTLGHPLGVHRTFFSSSQVSSAVAMAKTDLAHQRVPWMSFKVPYSWTDMANGKGDSWTKGLATRLAALDGPVWIALAHEPEGEGDIKQWTKMQKRLAPLVRAAAPNVAYSLILTGWNELYGPSQYRLASLWPDTKIDLIGFDVYDKYGVVKNGKKYVEHRDFVNDYFTKFQTFAKAHSTTWGLAETGQTDSAAVDDPKFAARTFQQMRANGGIAFSYFNTSLHSAATWSLHGAKETNFATALRATSTL